MKTKKTKQVLITKIFISFLLLFQFSCGKYSFYDHLIGKVENDKKIIDAKIKMDDQERDMFREQIKIDDNNRAIAEEKKKIDNRNKYQEERMVFVEGGYFTMQEREITISSFYISKYETTQEEYQNIMETNPSYSKGSNLPVEKVSWFDAIKYCNAKSKKEGLAVAYNESSGELLDQNGYSTNDITKVKGYRLPTESEWEYSARGGNKSQGYTYSGSNSKEEVAWYRSNSGNKTHDIGTKKANELGIYDMSGNVRELCTDSYDKYFYTNTGTTINPINTNSSSRVIRGGSWGSDDNTLHVNYRLNFEDFIYVDLGFRLVKTG